MAPSAKFEKEHARMFATRHPWLGRAALLIRRTNRRRQICRRQVTFWSLALPTIRGRRRGRFAKLTALLASLQLCCFGVAKDAGEKELAGFIVDDGK